MCNSSGTDDLFQKIGLKRKLKLITDIFLGNGSPDNVIFSNIESALSKFNSIKSFRSSECPVCVKIPSIGAVGQHFANKISGLVMRCFNSVQIIIIFTTWPAFQSFIKDVLPIRQQSKMVYKFQCQCHADYIGMSIQRLEVRIKHVPRELLWWPPNLTSELF